MKRQVDVISRWHFFPMLFCNVPHCLQMTLENFQYREVFPTFRSFVVDVKSFELLVGQR